MKPLSNPKEPLAKRLGIKEGHTVILQNMPPTVVITLGTEVKQARLQQTPGTDADMVLFFATQKKDLGDIFPSLQAEIAKHGALWIIWPKVIAGIPTDLHEASVTEIGKKHGMSVVNRCEIEYQYAGLKFVYRLQDR